MYKKIIPIIFLAFLVPQFALASWWNPLSWFNNWTFKKSVQVIPVPEVFTSPEQEIENTALDMKDPTGSLGVTSDLPASSVLPTTTKPTITIQKTLVPKFSEEASINREKLLNALRAGPFFDESKLHLEISSGTKCADGSLLPEKNEVSTSNLNLSQGIYISADGEADLHAYDNKGGHTGLMQKNPEYDFSFPEENAQGIDWINLGSAGYGLAIHENINGRIELVGKNYGNVLFEIRGNGNACGITEFYVPVTPSSVATLSMTTAGDLGPFSYDIDGDKKQDFLFSLKHPLFHDKQKQLDAVIEDMKNPE